MLLISVDKRIHIEAVGRLFIAPCVGSLFMGICCMWLKNCFGNLWIRTAVCVMSGVLVYGIMQLIMKNEIVIEIYVKGLELIGRKRK